MPNPLHVIYAENTLSVFITTHDIINQDNRIKYVLFSQIFESE